MAKAFSAKDAKWLYRTIQTLLNRLQTVGKLEQQWTLSIRSAAEALHTHEWMKLLEAMSVDELNREKRGIRVKTLRDCNLHTLADLYPLTVQQLSAINGISDDAARTIQSLVTSYAAKCKAATKIRLTLDDQSEWATQLVTAIAIYLAGRSEVHACQTYLGHNRQMLTAQLQALKSAKSMLRWLFLSKGRKADAEAAYSALLEQIHTEETAKIDAALSALDTHCSMSAENAWLTFGKDPIPFQTVLEQLASDIVGTDNSVSGLPEALAEEIKTETFSLEGLYCTLRSYQKWGVHYILHQKRVLLGDEMGLGKTVQAIASMVALHNAGATHFMVLCPASVLPNWCREITKHSILQVFRIHGADRMETFSQWIAAGGVAVTTYETTKHLVLPEHFPFSMLIVDEAHYIKNDEAQRTRYAKRLAAQADRLLFMTGTALENRVDEMIELIEILQPDIATQIKKIAFLSTAPQFRETIAPVYYRRRREDVLTELPALTEIDDWCSMTDTEERIYDRACLRKDFTACRRVSWNVPDLSQSSKAQRLLEIVAEATAENRKIIVFTFFLDTVDAVVKLLGDCCLTPLTGAMNPAERQAVLDELEQAPAGTVLAAQIQSGGTGLNIQSASVVVICEPQFKPSIENQAIARAYRMGQARNVLVHRLLCEDTVDERLSELLDAKQTVFDTFADTSAAAENTPEIEPQTFDKIMQDETARIQQKYAQSSKPTE